MIDAVDRISRAFIDLLQKKPYNKITVQDIVDECGIHRNTFYYHYPDIAILLQTIAEATVDEIIEKNFQAGSPIDCICSTVQFAEKNKKILLNIYNSLGKETLLISARRISFYSVREYIDRATTDIPMQEEDRELMTRYYSAVAMGALLDWFDRGMNYDLAAQARRICGLLEGSSEMAFRRSRDEKINA